MWGSSSWPPPSLPCFYTSLAEVSWQLLPVPPAEELQKVACLIDPKDAHVLAAALEGGSELILTLDRRQILAAGKAVEETGLPIRILTPGDFIWQCYPLHEGYPSLPPRSE